jgi:hypothetical protein
MPAGFHEFDFLNVILGLISAINFNDVVKGQITQNLIKIGLKGP